MPDNLPAACYELLEWIGDNYEWKQKTDIPAKWRDAFRLVQLHGFVQQGQPDNWNPADSETQDGPQITWCIEGGPLVMLAEAGEKALLEWRLGEGKPGKNRAMPAKPRRSPKTKPAGLTDREKQIADMVARTSVARTAELESVSDSYVRRCHAKACKLEESVNGGRSVNARRKLPDNR